METNGGVGDEEDEECSGHGFQAACAEGHHAAHEATTTQRVAEKVSSGRIWTGFTRTTN